MKLLRYGSPQREKPGLLDDEGAIRDLSAHIDDISPQTVTPKSLARLAALNSRELPVVGGTPRLGVPVKGIGKFIAIGLNYADHAKEANLPIPAEPPMFTKAISCLSGPNDDVERGTQWDKGKGCDTFGPVGPWLVTADELGDPQNLEMFLDLNGRRMQTGNTGRMIFPVRQLIAYVSRFITMHPGDLLITGTPPGVGLGRKPDPVFLKPGDEMRLGIEKLGEQRQKVIPWRHLGEDAAQR